MPDPSHPDPVNATGSPEEIELRFHLEGSDLERLVVVGGDLEYLVSLPRDRLLTHTEVRISAGVLRRLLVDDQLGRLWRSMGAPKGTHPSVVVTDIDTALAQWPERWVRYAWAGGAAGRTAHHKGLIVGVVPAEAHRPFGSPEEYFAANPLPFVGSSVRMTVNAWLRSTSVAVRTADLRLVPISRRAVLTYVANRKGGVHFDPTRNLEVPRGKARARKEVEAHLLDHGLLRVGHLSGPEFEVASLVHAVAESEWAQDLVRIAQDAAPDEFGGDPNEMKFWTGVVEADGTRWATTTFSSEAETSS